MGIANTGVTTPKSKEQPGNPLAGKSNPVTQANEAQAQAQARQSLGAYINEWDGNPDTFDQDHYDNLLNQSGGSPSVGKGMSNAVKEREQQWETGQPSRDRDAQRAQHEAEMNRIQQETDAAKARADAAANQQRAQQAVADSNEALAGQKPQLEDGGGGESTAGIDGSSRTKREKKARNRLSSNLGI